MLKEKIEEIQEKKNSMCSLQDSFSEYILDHIKEEADSLCEIVKKVYKEKIDIKMKANVLYEYSTIRCPPLGVHIEFYFWDSKYTLNSFYVRDFLFKGIAYKRSQHKVMSFTSEKVNTEKLGLIDDAVKIDKKIAQKINKLIS